MEDLVSKHSISVLVDELYLRIENDDLLSPYFAGIDWRIHKSRMVAFWSFILLEEPGYVNNVFDIHRGMAIGEKHFKRWLMHFEESINANFIGPKSDFAIERARMLSITFASKMSAKGE